MSNLGVGHTEFLAKDGFQHVRVKVIANEGVALPQYHTEEAACCDIHAQIPTDESGAARIALNHRSSVKLSTGMKVEVPKGYKLVIAARSGWATKGLIVTNAPAQIDSDFRDTVHILLLNVGREIIEIKHNDRIAQCWLEPVIRITWEPTDKLSETKRGQNGFGHTGNS